MAFGEMQVPVPAMFNASPHYESVNTTRFATRKHTNAYPTITCHNPQYMYHHPSNTIHRDLDLTSVKSREGGCSRSQDLRRRRDNLPCKYTAVHVNLIFNMLREKLSFTSKSNSGRVLCKGK